MCVCVYMYILLYACCVSFIVINLTISISCKKIYGKINYMDMNMNNDAGRTEESYSERQLNSFMNVILYLRMNE